MPRPLKESFVQEEELQDREQALIDVERKLQDAQRQVGILQEENEKACRVNEELRSKLEDSKQQLKGNEQMIRWLNAQVCRASRDSACASDGSSAATIDKPWRFRLQDGYVLIAVEYSSLRNSLSSFLRMRVQHMNTCAG
jgi:hypothetical protein